MGHLKHYIMLYRVSSDYLICARYIVSLLSCELVEWEFSGSLSLPKDTSRIIRYRYRDVAI